MDKNIAVVTSVVCVCLTVAFGFYLKYKSSMAEYLVYSNVHDTKGRELEIGIYDQYNYCLNSVMKRSKDNGRPCSLEDAERACAKFNTVAK